VAEFLFAVAVWIALVVFLSRKGTAHLLRPYVPVVLPFFGALAAIAIEALPTTPVSPGFTIRTVIAALAGVFAARLLVKVLRFWAAGAEKRAAAANPGAPPERVIHPLIAAGLLVAGIPSIWHLVTSSHELLEATLTPRDAKTGIVHGAEELRLDPPQGKGRAALLVHGLFGSPADFGELPNRLVAEGFAVHAPLLPGHGRRPDDLDAVWADDYRKAVRKEYDALAASHAKVAVVGGSMGATLALLQAAEKPPAALVLVSPYLGHLATPSWSPFEFDSLVGPGSRVIRRVFVSRPPTPHAYLTHSLHAIRQCRDLAAGVDAAAAKVKCPTLVIVGDRDPVVPADSTVAWTSAHLKADVRRLPDAWHALFTDGIQTDDALGAVVSFSSRAVRD
jgi:carboxylesterase